MLQALIIAIVVIGVLEALVLMGASKAEQLRERAEQEKREREEKV